MGCASSKNEALPHKPSLHSTLGMSEPKSPSSSPAKAITFQDDVPLRTHSSGEVSGTPGHERQKSITAGLRLERKGSASSNEGGRPSQYARLKKKTSDASGVDGSGSKHSRGGGSNLQENLIALNSSSTHVRDFYDGIDGEDNILGSGNWGVVRVVIRKRDGKRFACKVVNLDKDMADGQVEELRMEIDALRQLDHVAIAKLFETFEEPGKKLYLIMELLTGGELYSSLVERSPTGRFDELRTRKLARKMVSAIAYLHDKGLVHRDIKLENFCFRGDESHDEIVLIDFGLAKLYEMKQNMTEVVGSSYYVAPEIIEGSYSGPTPDMWSMGVILFMMLSGRPPFDGSSDQNIMRRAVKGRFTMDDEVWRSEVSTLAQDFVRRCLTRDPSARMTSKEGLRHAWLTASEEALIDAGAGDDPARALAPAVIPSVVSEAMNSAKRASRRISATIFGPGASDEILDRLRFFASRHELVRLFSQAVAFSLGREEVRDLTKLFVKLDRDGDGLITAADVEVGLLDAPPNEVDDGEIKSRGGSFTIINSTPRSGGSKFPGFHIQDEATRQKRKRRREANYLFAAMDVQKKSMVSLNELIAATLPTSFYQDERLLGDAFARLCGTGAGTQPQDLVLAVGGLQGMLGSRFTERRAKRWVGEFVALARFGSETPNGAAKSKPSEEPTTPGKDANGSSAKDLKEASEVGSNRPSFKDTATESNSKSFRANSSERKLLGKKFGSRSHQATDDEENDSSNNLNSPRRLDVDVITFNDFIKGMIHGM